MTPNIDLTLRKRRIIIACGTGGVGKTTLSAALALRAATLGKKAVVITIDPAKRLATSLGLDELGDHATDLTHLVHEAYEKARAAGEPVPPTCTGTLAAIMPDTRRTFEAFVASLAPSRETADRVMRNPIFQIFAKEFSGTNEYMALERLYALDSLRKYDSIILDTPPSRNTLAFLDAPTLLSRFFDEKLIRWLVMPANKIVSAGMRKALGILEKLTGAGFMTHLIDFASALFEVQANFSSNLKRVTALLGSPDVGFLLVASPAPDTAAEAAHFVNSLKAHRFHFDGVALNRSLSYLKISPEERKLAQTEQAAGRDELAAALAIVDCLQKRESSGRHQQVIAKLPELARDVHSVEDLFHVAMAFDRIGG